MTLGSLRGRVTIVMYHYVRDLAHSRYAGIKGLDVEAFRGQIEYCRRGYQLISMQQFLAAARGHEPLPENAMLLTFDDAYVDHFTFVFPILSALCVPASFFPPAKAILDHQVLDVNKIHFILAVTAGRESELLEEIWSDVDEYRQTIPLKRKDEYEAMPHVSRFDTFEVQLIKRLLQVELPAAVREPIVSRLFARYVSADEGSFARELYLSIDQVRCLLQHGMYIGSHGFQHVWLDHMTPAEQELEIRRSLEFLSSVGSDTRDWVMCYPYGRYDDSLLRLLRANSCAAGLTTRVGVADLSSDDLLMLPRLDTNDLPRHPDTAVHKRVTF